MNNGELIENLPYDKTTTHSEDQIKIAKMLFKDNESTLNVLAKELKDESADNLTRRFVPSANGSYMILVGVKSIIVVVLYYVIKNFSLARKTC